MTGKYINFKWKVPSTSQINPKIVVIKEMSWAINVLVNLPKMKKRQLPIKSVAPYT
jgi:hypothetical protein